jgi:hypothetical protein
MTERRMLRDRDIMHLTSGQRAFIRRSAKSARQLAIKFGVPERVIRTVRSTAPGARSFTS